MWLGPAPWAPYHPDRCLYKFRFFMDYAGGNLTNNGVHMVDMAQWGNGTDHTGPVELIYEGGMFPKDGLFDASSPCARRGTCKRGAGRKTRDKTSKFHDGVFELRIALGPGLRI